MTGTWWTMQVNQELNVRRPWSKEPAGKESRFCWDSPRTLLANIDSMPRKLQQSKSSEFSEISFCSLNTNSGNSLCICAAYSSYPTLNSCLLSKPTVSKELRLWGHGTYLAPKMNLYLPLLFLFLISTPLLRCQGHQAHPSLTSFTRIRGRKNDCLASISVQQHSQELNKKNAGDLPQRA